MTSNRPFPAHRPCRFSGWGRALPSRVVEVPGGTRYRVAEGETQLSLAVSACRAALEKAGIGVEDVDCIVSASAVGIQPIPCTAALIHEQIALGTDIPALDINTTCTSFITAVDLMSCAIATGRYQRVLIVSSEAGSGGLNPEQRESFELFSDGAAALILEALPADEEGDGHPSGVLGAVQATWSEGAHSTEIRGGGTALHASGYRQETAADYQFDMQGPQVLRLAAKVLPGMADSFARQTGQSVQDADLIIPHQASGALGMMMKRLGIPRDRYIDQVADYGNMISASIPFILCGALEEQEIGPGNTVLLYGTAAGLTVSMLAFRL